MINYLLFIFKLVDWRSKLVCALLLIFIVNPFSAFAQRYSFTHYDIEDGLTQSQVWEIAQDNSHHLLVATKLGIGRFDGKYFASITKDNGLPDNFISSITTDKKGGIWGSGPNSLYYYFAGRVQKNAATGSSAFAGARALLTDAEDNIWGIKGRTLFNITGGRARQVNVSGGTDTISAIAKSTGGIVYAVVHNKGVFCFRNNKWVEVLHLGILKNKDAVKQVVVDVNDPEHCYILTNQQILSAKGSSIQSLNIPKNIINTAGFVCLDNQHGLWMGALQGAYYLNLDNNNLIYFNENNGFTNNTVNHIFRDIDNSIWLGTNGAGLYRFNGNSFVSFNQTDKFTDPNIMQFTRDINGDILMASSGSGLFVFNGKKIDKIDIPSDNPLTKKVFSFCRDNNNNIWIGTLFGGLWKKTGNQITRVYLHNKNDTSISFNDIKLDSNNTLWLSTSSGCYYLDKKGVFVKVFNANCGPLCVLGHDSILVASTNRLVLLKGKKPVRGFKTSFPNGSNILCIKYHKGRVYVGTIDYGLFVCDPGKRTFIRLSKQDGLLSNSIYSVGISDDNVLWLGTGRGINKFKINDARHFEKIADDNIANLLSECNQNSLAFFDGQVWIGTTKGLYVLKDRPSDPITRPYTIIQDVQFFNKQPVDYIYENGYKIPHKLELPSGNSHITISFKGVNLKSPGSVSYSYMLSPLENKFSHNSKNDFVDYPSLPPGSYTFYARSSSLDGVPSNATKFSFEINPSFYQTVWFKVILVLLALAIIISLWKYSKTKDAKKRLLVERLRHEEQVKIRQQTAEDFHDDLGNKLTRINMLSDILSKRIGGDSTEEKQLISQIKENADALFTGSKHILWALDPGNDQLSEVLNHLSDFGIDMFLNSPINFSSMITVNEFSEITLPMGHGRNITMIFKELFNNALKHSDAENITLSTEVNKDGDICIILTDDGKGFDQEHTKKGHGLNNVNKRAKKINGTLHINSAENKGTQINLVLKGYKHLLQSK